MTTVRIARVVKYNGVVYPANTDILVEDKDVADLLSRGGWVINKDAPAASTAAAENAENSTAGSGEEGADENSEGDFSAAGTGSTAGAAHGTDGTADLSELDALKARAAELGIVVKSNWGIPKLTKEIAAAESK